MFCKEILILSCLFLSVISKQDSFENFIKDNPKVNDKIQSTNLESSSAKVAYGKCSKPGNGNYLDETPFIMEQSSLCKGRVSLLVAVHSNNPNRARRQMIRETYGSVRRIGAMTIRLAFFVGQSSDTDKQQLLKEENEINGDVVQRDFIESYRNMTRKHVSVLEWVTKHCSHAEYLLKTDDDVFIDVYHIVREILDGRTQNGFLCSSTKNAHPNRSQKGSLKKWYVTKDEYRSNDYPTYCEGYGYIVPISFVPKLFACSIFNNFFWIDDVHVGGVLPQMLGIPRLDFSPGGGFFYMLPSHASHKVLDGIFFVAYFSEIVQHQWRKMWHAVIEYSMNL